MHGTINVKTEQNMLLKNQDKRVGKGANQKCPQHSAAVIHNRDIEVKEQICFLATICPKSKRKANWIGHILHRNCFYNRLLKER
jgi:hypothetical protein